MDDNSFYDDFVKPLFVFGSAVTILLTIDYIIKKNIEVKSSNYFHNLKNVKKIMNLHMN